MDVTVLGMNHPLPSRMVFGLNDCDHLSSNNIISGHLGIVIDDEIAFERA